MQENLTSTLLSCDEYCSDIFRASHEQKISSRWTEFRMIPKGQDASHGTSLTPEFCYGSALLALSANDSPVPQTATVNDLNFQFGTTIKKKSGHHRRLLSIKWLARTRNWLVGKGWQKKPDVASLSPAGCHSPKSRGRCAGALSIPRYYSLRRVLRLINYHHFLILRSTQSTTNIRGWWSWCRVS